MKPLIGISPDGDAPQGQPTEAEYRVRMRSLVKAFGAPFLVGTLEYETSTNPPGSLNSAVLLPNTVRFLTLIPRAKKALAQVRCPLTLVFFRRDETVRFSSARLALRLAPHAGIAALDGSSHFYFSPADQATMVSLVQHLIDAPASGA